MTYQKRQRTSQPVEAVKAVRQNADVGLHALFATNGKGFVFDIPLVGLSGGALNVEKDSPVTIELEAMGAENKFGYTMMYVNFPLLPKIECNVNDAVLIYFVQRLF